MKTIKEIKKPDGTRRMIIELAPGETLLPVRKDGFYQLGNPVGDVIAGYILAETWPVTWCSVGQRWEA